MNHYKYSSISQFRNAVKKVRELSSYVGTDINGLAIYKEPTSHPIIEFNGTVKLHGANSGIVYENGDVYAQSRNNVITVENDSYGFALFVSENKKSLISWFESFEIKYKKYVAYGEWCGGNIQKGVGINSLPKMLIIFDIRAINDEGDTVIEFGTDLAESCSIENFHSIEKFSKYSILIDFNQPEISQNILSDWTDNVEKNCPVSSFFGVKGIGEGIVYTGEYNGKKIMFKVKGQKHSQTNVKELAKVDVEKLNSVKEYVNYAVTENRVMQAMTECEAYSAKDTGTVIKWIFNDVIKEELDVLEKSGLSKKDIGKEISIKTKGYFFDLLDK